MRANRSHNRSFLKSDESNESKRAKERIPNPGLRRPWFPLRVSTCTPLYRVALPRKQSLYQGHRNYPTAQKRFMNIDDQDTLRGCVAVQCTYKCMVIKIIVSLSFFTLYTGYTPLSQNTPPLLFKPYVG